MFYANAQTMLDKNKINDISLKELWNDIEILSMQYTTSHKKAGGVFNCQGKALFYIVEFFVDPKNGTLENK